MKKVFSLVLLLAIAVSLAFTSVVAFAADETAGDDVIAREVTCNEEKAKEFLNGALPTLTVDMKKEFILNTDWLKDKEKLNSVFTNLQYVFEGDADYDAKKSENDKFYVEYCTPSKDYKESWSSVTAGNKFEVNSAGWWLFRVVVKDKDDKELCKTPQIARYAVDNSHPESDLSSTQKDRQKDGLTVGTSYSISTSLSITSNSSTTVTYKVYKKVNGEWTAEPIYDSVKKEVAEGYKDCISDSGTITPLASDVLEDKEPIYKIVYSVKSANGYYGVDNKGDKVDPELLLFVSAADSGEEENIVKRNNVIIIVCSVIAGLSFIGILLVSFIKPKQTVSADSDSKETSESKKD